MEFSHINQRKVEDGNMLRPKASLIRRENARELPKRAASGAMALILAAGAAMPAFASEDHAEAVDSNDSEAMRIADTENSNASPSADSAQGKADASSNSQAVATSPEAEAPTASPIETVSQTVPLAPSGESIPETSTVSASSKAPSAEDAQDSQADTEICTWTYEDGVWSTMRGGSKMTVDDAIAFGIDVSEWQGDIDWAQVKSSGVQYAILRCAYGSSESGHEDAQFAANVKGCKENGIPFGVYLYSNNSTVDGAAAEAQHALSAMEKAGIVPNDLILPVYYDIEDKVHKDMTPESRGDLAETFCSAIETAGYTPGIYASQSWFDGLLTDSRFGQWSKWVASYPSTGTEGAISSYAGAHDIWQCMSRGKIDGISTRVDINFDYRFGETHYDAIYDYDFYMESNPDVASAVDGDRTAAFYHFMTSGMAEGRISSPSFNLHGYFNSNVDLRREFGLNLKSYYLHYQETGQAEGRPTEDSMVPINLVRGIHVMDLSSIYDPYIYLANNEDLEEEFTLKAQGFEYIDDVGLFRHFINTGINEGRIAK